jgi:hypothetical protein
VIDICRSDRIEQAGLLARQRSEMAAQSQTVENESAVVARQVLHVLVLDVVRHSEVADRWDHAGQ